ncbi:MAG: hypothetical protein JWL86_1393 [Rhizobium sp.]|nr:hypothetical protein [Rhizobium sp.]
MSIAIQAAFARALRDKAAAVPSGLEAWNGARPERRFGVYRNNVFWGLVESLRSRFPVTAKIVGDEFFTGMADVFIRAHPPISPLLLAYGDDLPGFAETFPPLAQLPYLADVIRLEIARSHAYHAADRAPLDRSVLSGLAAERLPELVFEAHPSSSVVRSSHPILTIWSMNSGEIPPAPIEPWIGQDALVVRPDLIVNVHSLPLGGAVFMAALRSGGPLGAAVEAALDDDPGFDITANLAGVLQTGSFIAIH